MNGLSQAYRRRMQLKGAWHTDKEISQQPSLWKNIFEKIFSDRETLSTFLEKAYDECDHIVFTGAGTSAFIGLSLHGLFFRKTGMMTRAIATTDIVSHPQDYFNKNQTSFVISFARSGNSPESYAALELADQFSKKCFHLIITCDAKGSLASYRGNQHQYIKKLY